MARPSKMTYSEKQTIVNNYFLLECESNPEKLKSRGLYSELSSFSTNNGFSNVKAYDFSRDKKLLAYIDTLYESQISEVQKITTAFKSFDIDYYLRKDISDAEKRSALLDLESYYKNCEEYIRNNVLPEKAEEILNQKKDPKQIVESLSSEKSTTKTDYRAKLHSNLVVLK